MKKLVFFIWPVLVLAACSKYEDGPAISLRSKYERISNTWKVSSALKNGEDHTPEFNGVYGGYVLDIRKNETYSLTYTPTGGHTVNDNGRWNFTSDQLKVMFTDEEGRVTEYLILKLKEKEFWVQFIDDKDNWEVHMVPQ